MKAYDYDEQVWKDGIAGARVRLEQLSEELKLLTGERADEYLAFTQSKARRAGHPVMTKQAAIEACERGIAECWKEIIAIEKPVAAQCQQLAIVDLELAGLCREIDGSIN
jgi:hypothetical protein